MTTESHSHITDDDVTRQPEADGRWYRCYIDHPNYLNESGVRVPKLLGGGSREHCERVLKEYRKKNFAATQWPSKIVEIAEPERGKEPKVSFP